MGFATPCTIDSGANWRGETMTEQLNELTAGMIVHVAHTRGWTIDRAAEYIREHMAEARVLVSLDRRALRRRRSGLLSVADAAADDAGGIAVLLTLLISQEGA